MPFFLAPLLTALGGGSLAAGATLAGGVAGAAINAASQSSTNRANAAATRDANAAAREENREAREWNRQQVFDERMYQEEQAAIAEAKAKAAIAEDREYNSPAAVRARLEAAGINPLSGFQDASTDVSGYGPASVAIAQNIAQSSGVAFTNGAPVIAPQYQAVDVGSQLSNAFANYGNAFQAQQELDLRKSALRLEEQQVSNIVARANLKPVVGGIYDSPNPQSGLFYGPSSAVSSSDPARPLETVPLWITVFDEMTGQSFRMPNPDLLETGPTEMAAGAGLVASFGGVAVAEKFLTTPSKPNSRPKPIGIAGFKPQRNISFDNSPPRRFNNGVGDRFMSEAQRWALE